MQKEFLEKSYRPAIIAGLCALLVSSLLIAMKTMAWFATGSVLIMASLVDSVGDFVISTINFFAIKHAKKPADRNHRYGHGKVEGIASVFQGAIIAGAGFFVLLEAVKRLSEPGQVKDIEIAVAVMVVSVIMTLILVFIQTRMLKRSKSLAVEADQSHYKGDVAVNLSIILVLAAGYFGAPAWVDPLAAVMVAGYLGFSAWQISKKGVDMLLDREVGGDIRENIMSIVLSHKEIHGMHDLRTRYTGNHLHIAFDVEMEPDLLLCDAHKIVKDLEQELLSLYPHSEIMIHKDPIGETEDSRHQVKGVHI